MKVRSYLPLIIISILVAALFTAKLTLDIFGISLVRNITPSLPLGLYYQTRNIEWRRGEILNVELPTEIKKKLRDMNWLNLEFPILKSVLGLPGDRVCKIKGRLKLNGRPVAKTFDDKFKASNLYLENGCFKIKKDEFLPVNVQFRHSFDGRYLGALKKTAATGHLNPIFVYKFGGNT